MTRQKVLGWLGAALVATVTVACGQTDPGITTAVKSKLAADDVVKAYRIDVDTKDKVVTLKGEVDNEIGRTRAVELARDTKGVRDVVDSLIVAPGVTPTTGIDDSLKREASEVGNLLGDAGITTAVKTKMLADTTVSGLKLDVDTKDGIVTLSGNVRSAVERDRALELSRETTGVKSVVDRMKITPER